MTYWDKNVYTLWRQKHPDFDPKDYARWVKERGYYKFALDFSRPEFYEYVTVYLNKQRSTA